LTAETGTKLGHYEIRAKLGAGGMGEVYLGQDTKLDRKVAIKFLHEEFSKDADKLARFIQEAKAASALNHPNILTVYEIGEIASQNYIATELIDGHTLRHYLAAKDPLPLNQILKIGVQVSEALAAAHQAGIIHRDIKPEDIMIRYRQPRSR
jgi:serine/threonine protein kinase